MIEIMQGDIQQTAQDVKAATGIARDVMPYLWECLAGLGVLFCLRVTNTIKRQRWYPAFLCDLKTSKDGKHQYYKLKNFYIDSFAHLSSFGILVLALKQKYALGEGLLIACAIISVSIFVLVKPAFAIIKTKSPEVAEALADGVYVQEEDMTMMTKFTQIAITGGGVDKRK